jgi:hypothetical protein
MMYLLVKQRQLTIHRNLQGEHRDRQTKELSNRRVRHQKTAAASNNPEVPPNEGNYDLVRYWLQYVIEFREKYDLGLRKE